MSAPEQIREHGALTGRRLGAYSLCELLASGGVAEVYRALDQTSGREVAIKAVSITLSDNPDVGARFRIEAHRLASFRHTHIVPLYAFGEADDLIYFAMPLVPGSLRKRLEAEGRLSPMQATRLTLQVASALSAAHAQGLVHRDIKPENILIDRDGDALLTDFGIARELAALQLEGVTWTLSSIGLPVGTPEYMPPEQLRGEPADQRVDVYALGAVLYEMLTGQAPHEGATPWAVAAQVLMNEITPPSAHAPDIWPALERLVLSALARRPDGRPADMLTFEEALRDALGVMEEQWETYFDVEFAAVAAPAQVSLDAADPALRFGDRRAFVPLAPTAHEEATAWEDGPGSNWGIGVSAALRPWRAAYRVATHIASNFVTSATLSWWMTNQTYQARADFLRQALERCARSSVRRSLQFGPLRLQSAVSPS
jgi:serine/threonine protein kinase